MIRAFLGLDLPPDLRGALRLKQFLLPMPRKIDSEAMHLTLVFLGDCPEPALEAAHEGFLALQEAAFPLTLQGLGLFGGDRLHAAWAGVAASPALGHLQAKVETIARRAGCPVPRRKFHPHVTLGRFPPLAFPEAARLERAIAEGMAFRSRAWAVDRLTLWQSHLGPKGARYDELAIYPLLAPGPEPLVPDGG